MILQWHITDRCNLKCKHCYCGDDERKSRKEKDPSYKEMVLVVSQFCELVTRWPDQIHEVRLTGGEPMLHNEWENIAALIRERPNLSWRLLTNGVLITPPKAKNIARLEPSNIQVSIEGGKEIHDKIRGEGNLDLVLEGVRNLRSCNIPVVVSMTIHKQNMKEIPKVVSICEENDVQVLWSDRVIPWGEGASLQNLEAEDVCYYLQSLSEERIKQHLKGKNFVKMNRALQFLYGGECYSCGAGSRLLTVLPNGDVFPCRRLPIKIGNVFEETLEEIYLTNPLCMHLRNPNIIPSKCKECKFSTSCRGGLKCLSYVLTGDPFAGDPGCPVNLIS